MVGHVRQLDVVEDPGGQTSLTESPPAEHRHVRGAELAAVVERLELVRVLHTGDDLTVLVEVKWVVQLDQSYG